MSRFGLTLGLIASLALHLWLLRPASAPASPTDNPPPKPDPALAQAVQVMTLPPKPQPQPQQAKPQPAPQTPPTPRPPAPEPPTPPAPPTPKPPIPPAPPAPASAPAEKSGDFSGSRNASQHPALRIDWGDATTAPRVLQAGRMRLVVLRATPTDTAIHRELAWNGSQWQLRTPAADVAGQYSNRLRIVTRVPAFAPALAAADMTAHDNLAVLVPRQVERLLDTAQLRAAQQRALTLDRIRAFGGRFDVQQGQLTFTITHVQQRSDG